MHDLLALATIRRMMLELGHELRLDGENEDAGLLERWMRTPRDDLDGETPLQALQQPEGQEEVRRCVAALVAQTRNEQPNAAGNR